MDENIYILSEGTLLLNGKYRIEKHLSSGGFGNTYKATTKTGLLKYVAIKEFFMSEMNSRSKDGSSIEGSNGSLFSNYRQKFRKEAENLSKLDHSNIVHVLDVFDENNTTYYVMQYIDGQSLDEYILQQGCIAESKARAIVKEVGAAVQYMHSNKMLHLDLKPKNVMLDQNENIYLIDFGLSKQYDRPPEASDILNDGFPLYELQEHKISDRVSASVAKAMAPAKKDRYQTVEDFLNSFEDEATVIDVEVSSGKENSKSQTTNQNLYSILPITKKVEISYVPTFPVAGIMYDAIIKRDEIQIRSGVQKATWDISRKAFSKFLTSLNSLSLNVRKKENPEYMEASETADKLTITLYDNNNSVYAKYWIGGWKNQFGNIIGETLTINEKVKQIIPHLEDFLSSSSENENKKDDEKVVRPEKVKKFLQIPADTSKVRIEYWPYSLFPPRYNGAFITTITAYEVNPNVTQWSIREMIPMTQGKYEIFLNALQALKLEMREEAVEQFKPGSFSPAKLKISLYDKDGVIYNDLWIDGMNGGNIVGNVDAIEKQIIRIVPGLSKYLNGPFYEVPELIKENEIKMKSSRSEATKPIHKDLNTGNGKISYRWWAILVLAVEIGFTWFMFMFTCDRESQLDSDGRILSGLYFVASLLCVYYLFKVRKNISLSKWKKISFISTFACYVNSCMLPIWNGSLTRAYFLLSLGLSIVSSFTLLIKKSA